MSFFGLIADLSNLDFRLVCVVEGDLVPVIKALDLEARVVDLLFPFVPPVYNHSERTAK